jgi:hypothetical protein
VTRAEKGLGVMHAAWTAFVPTLDRRPRRRRPLRRPLRRRRARRSTRLSLTPTGLGRADRGRGAATEPPNPEHDCDDCDYG